MSTTNLSSLDSIITNLPVSLRVTLPNGSSLGPSDAQLAVKINNNATLALLSTGQAGALGQAYVEGKLDFTGSVRDLMRVAVAILPDDAIDKTGSNAFLRFLGRIHSMWRHTLERDARQIQFHYDISDEFYALWLDPRRVYSCAYFRENDYSLEAAQEAKLEHICKKLRLQSGERFLDVGAGWGGLLLWAAEHYDVTALGITLSENQHRYVNQLIQEKGLSGRVRMKLLDYRNVHEHEDTFDKIASVGMFEHVGRAQLTEYFTILRKLLKPGGLLLNHGITSGVVNHKQMGAGMGEFIERYIFPGGELTHIAHVLEHSAEAGLEDLDTENLRPHYARTLWHWSDRLEARLDEARAVLGPDKEKSLRAYRLYLAGCAVAFEQEWVALHQVLAQHRIPTQAVISDELAVPEPQAYPWRRDYIYDQQ